MTLRTTIIDIETCYRRPFVPKGCRVERVEYPLMKEYGSISQIERNEAALAFRLHYPIAALPKNDRTVNVLCWHGRIYWPRGESVVNRTGVVGNMSLDDWRHSIESDRDLTRILPTGETPVAKESFSRFALPDGRDDALLEVKRDFAERFLICDGFVYTAGGVPVYALWQYEGSRRVSIVGTGIDRAIGEPGKPLSPHAAFYATAPTERAFVSGQVWLPGKKVTAGPSHIPVPEIEVLKPGLITPDLIDHVRIDALFRACMRNLDWLIWRSLAPGASDRRYYLQNPAKSTFGTAVRDAFAAALEPGADNYATSNKRLAALRALFEAERDIPKKHLKEVGALQAGFAEINARFPSEVLATEDEAALDRLAI
ncbi:hypothetical protein ACVIW2_005915 [Bradyrhizobium huanghuaihaiense]